MASDHDEPGDEDVAEYPSSPRAQVVKKRKRQAYDTSRDKHLLAIEQVIKEIPLQDITRSTKAMCDGQALSVGQMICDLRNRSLTPEKLNDLAKARLKYLQTMQQWRDFVSLPRDGKRRQVVKSVTTPPKSADVSRTRKSDIEIETKVKTLTERILQIEYECARKRIDLLEVELCLWKVFKDPKYLILF